MSIDEIRQNLLRQLPGVDHILNIANQDGTFEEVPKTVLVSSIRSVIEGLREDILKKSENVSATDMENNLTDSHVIQTVKKMVEKEMTPNLLPLINATGVVVHTNLGRSLLSKEAVQNMAMVSIHYSNLEFDISSGKRGLRYSCVEDLLCEISGAESALVVNNNAAAVLLCLETIAKEKEVIVSRGELVEIGGSFRIPDVMTKSGCMLKEVGTTNRTHPRDYENAVRDRTGLLLKVHTSNYAILGFTSQVSLKELVDIGSKYHLPVMEDLGSGTFIDFSKYGMPKEPTVQESVASGIDVVTFSGDKLLGGPQAGIIVGKKEILEQIKKNPLTRALRIDKTTLAALESTLRLYRDENIAVSAIPTLRMLTSPVVEIERKAILLEKGLNQLNYSSLNVSILDLSSKAGGGSLPLLELPSKCVSIKINTLSANEIETFMRNHAAPIIGRIYEDLFILDLRTIFDDELSLIVDAVSNLLKRA